MYAKIRQLITYHTLLLYRANIEDSHTKSINKLHKQMGHSSDTTIGYVIYVIYV